VTLTVLHVLPHAGGGAETYIDLLEAMDGVRHERLALSSGRTIPSLAGCSRYRIGSTSWSSHPRSTMSICVAFPATRADVAT